jgi:UDP-glucose 4-epimerase
VRRLAAEGGHSIRVVDNLLVGTRDDLAAAAPFHEVPPTDVARTAWGDSEVELLVGDILDEGFALGAVEGADVIVHLAANTGVAPSVEDPRTDCVTNVIGTFNYLEAARQQEISRFVYASSGAVVGECDPPLHEEVVPHPVSPYGASKACGEMYCSSYSRTFGLHTAALRFSNVYGPGSSHKQSAVAKFIRKVLAGEVIEIYGDGRQTRDFIFVDDLTDAIVRAATAAGIGGEAFQIATNRETTVLGLVNELKDVLTQAGYADVRVTHGEPRLGDVRRNYADTSKAKQLLGWEPKTGLRDGLSRTLEWYLRTRG